MAYTKHIFNVSQKLEQLNIDLDKNSEYIRKTLHQDVLYEFSSLNDYENKKSDSKWLQKKLENFLAKKQSKVFLFEYVKS